MNAKPLSHDVRGHVLTITLDTPACEVNIFTEHAAAQLLEILDALDSNVRAVVFRSAKAASFINGASLMLASAIARPEDLPRLTSTIQRAYRALGDLKVPTIAAIRGTCFGCGVELALRCRYRIAGDSSDARFYMPEIADYLLVPTFGSTQVLPRLLGLEGATEFLLWGSRWAAREALRRGLIHACIPDSEFDATVEHAAAQIADRGSSSVLRESTPMTNVDVGAFGARTRARIRRLPSAYRDVYGTCYALIEQAATKEIAEAEDYEAEVLASGRSIMAPVSKRAAAFFFVRQLSEQIALRGVAERPSLRVRCDMSSAAPAFLRTELEELRIRGLTLHDAFDESAETLHVVAYGSRALGATPLRRIAISDRLEPDPVRPSADLVVYAPGWRHGLRFAEVARTGPSESGPTAFRLLTKAGWTCVATAPKRGFMTNDLLVAYLGPQLAFLRAGGDRRELAATLLAFGFTRLAGDWLAGWDRERLADVLRDDATTASERSDIVAAIGDLPTLADADEAPVSEALEDAVLISLLAFARRALHEQSAGHPAVVDVAARELIDFPLGHTSLCRHLTVKRARGLFRHAGAARSLVPAGAFVSLEDYTAHGADFYR